MIGLDFSGCVAAVAAGELPIERVEKIISSTRCLTPETWDMVIARCRRCVWHRNPDAAEQIARVWISAGMVEQPRISATPRYPDPANGLWTDDETKIKWHDAT